MIESETHVRQRDPSITARDRLIVALDFDSKEGALEIVDRLGKEVGFYKVGYQLFIAEGRGFLKELVKRDKKIFLDLKMNDIDQTVENAVRVIAESGVEFLTLHGNGATAASAKRGRVNSETPYFLQVTYLSSLDQTDLKDIFGVDEVDMLDFIRNKAEAILKAGCDGLIASGPGVADLRRHLEGRVPPPIIVTPGIRPVWSVTDEHKQTLTPAEAIASGADYLVVGRPIYRATDPVSAAQKIIEEIDGALKS